MTLLGVEQTTSLLVVMIGLKMDDKIYIQHNFCKIVHFVEGEFLNCQTLGGMYKKGGRGGKNFYSPRSEGCIVKREGIR